MFCMQMKQTSKMDQRRNEDYLECRSIFVVVGSGLRWQKKWWWLLRRWLFFFFLVQRLKPMFFPYLILFWLLSPLSLSLFHSLCHCVFSFSGMFCFYFSSLFPSFILPSFLLVFSLSLFLFSLVSLFYSFCSLCFFSSPWFFLPLCSVPSVAFIARECMCFPW